MTAGARGRAAWLWRRVALMTPAELFHRARAAARNALVPLATTVPPAVAAGAFVAGPAPCLFRPPLAVDPEAGRRILAGDIPVFGRWVQAGPDPAFWHTDPLTGARWPRDTSSRIRYRPGNATGDVRITWELNRLQHLVTLAVLGAGDAALRPAAVARFEAQLAHWHAANPPGVGVNWLSAMESALRMVAVMHAFDLLRPWVGPATRAVVASLAVTHARHAERHLSLFSSAGNHTVAEGVGLLYAGTLLPEAREAQRWRKLGRALLAREAARQVLPDGGGLEQATGYLAQVRDLFALASALLAHAGAPREPAVDAAVARATAFLRGLDAGAGPGQDIGDSDGGAALAHGLALAPPAHGTHAGRCTFPAAGITVMGDGDGERVTFLHKPLGMAPGFAHGHADCLSVLLDAGGGPVLVDPGTGQYGAEPAWRSYFRSTRAHNTVTIDEADQALQAGPFQWQRPWAARLLACLDTGDTHLLVATHSGYDDRQASHVRGIWYRPGHLLVVRDVVDAPAAARVAARWHLGCPVQALPGGATFMLRPPAGPPFTLALRAGAARIARAETDPPLGWRSRAYAEREPCDVIEVAGTGSCEWIAVFAPGTPDAADVEAALAQLRAAWDGG